MAVVSFQRKRYPSLLKLVSEAEGKPSAADKVHDEILLRIIRGELDPNDGLKSTVIAEELDVSRTPVMAALARLCSDGIIDQTTNRKAVVRPGAKNWLLDVHRMRCLIEPEATRLCVGRIPQDIMDDLRQLQEDSKPEDGEWQKGAEFLDYSLHLVVGEFCGNLPMREVIRRYWNYKKLSYQEGDGSPERLLTDYHQHSSILNALINGDADEAANMMAEHLKSAGKIRPSERILKYE